MQYIENVKPEADTVAGSKSMSKKRVAEPRVSPLGAGGLKVRVLDEVKLYILHLHHQSLRRASGTGSRSP